MSTIHRNAVVAAVFDDDNLLFITLGSRAQCADTLRVAAALCKRWRAFATPLKLKLLRQVATRALLQDSNASNNIDASSEILGGNRNRLPAGGLMLSQTASAAPDEMRLAGDLANSYENSLPVLLEGGDFSGSVITYFAHLMHHAVRGPFVIVCPAHRVLSWQAALQRVAPGITVVVSQGPPKQRQAHLRALDKSMRDRLQIGLTVLITPYSLAIKDTNVLAKIDWKVNIWDHGVQELCRGWKPGSATYKLHRAMTTASVHSIMVEPSRVEDFESTCWVTDIHIGSTIDFFCGKWEVMAAGFVRHLWPLNFGHAESVTTTDSHRPLSIPLASTCFHPACIGTFHPACIDTLRAQTLCVLCRRKLQGQFGMSCSRRSSTESLGHRLRSERRCCREQAPLGSTATAQ